MLMKSLQEFAALVEAEHEREVHELERQVFLLQCQVTGEEVFMQRQASKESRVFVTETDARANPRRANTDPLEPERHYAPAPLPSSSFQSEYQAIDADNMYPIVSSESGFLQPPDMSGRAEITSSRASVETVDHRQTAITSVASSKSKDNTNKADLMRNVKSEPNPDDQPRKSAAGGVRSFIRSALRRKARATGKARLSTGGGFPGSARPSGSARTSQARPGSARTSAIAPSNRGSTRTVGGESQEATAQRRARISALTDAGLPDGFSDSDPARPATSSDAVARRASQDVASRRGSAQTRQHAGGPRVYRPAHWTKPGHDDEEDMELHKEAQLEHLRFQLSQDEPNHNTTHVAPPRLSFAQHLALMALGQEDLSSFMAASAGTAGGFSPSAMTARGTGSFGATLGTLGTVSPMRFQSFMAPHAPLAIQDHLHSQLQQSQALREVLFSDGLAPHDDAPVCDGCGNTFLLDAKFCRKCGKRRPGDQVCACGNVFAPDALFCRNCGKQRCTLKACSESTDTNDYRDHRAEHDSQYHDRRSTGGASSTHSSSQTLNPAMQEVLSTATASTATASTATASTIHASSSHAAHSSIRRGRSLKGNEEHPDISDTKEEKLRQRRRKLHKLKTKELEDHHDEGSVDGMGRKSLKGGQAHSGTHSSGTHSHQINHSRYGSEHEDSKDEWRHEHRDGDSSGHSGHQSKRPSSAKSTSKDRSVSGMRKRGRQARERARSKEFKEDGHSLAPDRTSAGRSRSPKTGENGHREHREHREHIHSNIHSTRSSMAPDEVINISDDSCEEKSIGSSQPPVTKHKSKETIHSDSTEGHKRGSIDAVMSTASSSSEDSAAAVNPVMEADVKRPSQKMARFSQKKRSIAAARESKEQGIEPPESLGTAEPAAPPEANPPMLPMLHIPNHQNPHRALNLGEREQTPMGSAGSGDVRRSSRRLSFNHAGGGSRRGSLLTGQNPSFIGNLPRGSLQGMLRNGSFLNTLQPGLAGVPRRVSIQGPDDWCDDSEASSGDMFELLGVWSTQIWRKSVRVKRDAGGDADEDELDYESYVVVTEAVPEAETNLGWFYKKLVIQPSSMKHLAWEMMGLAFIIWDVITIPMMVFEPEESEFTDVMQWILRSFWLLDVLMSFMTGYLQDQGTLEMRPVRIAKHYLRTWFLPDLICVGLDWATVVMQSVRNYRGLRIVRSVRLFRLLKAPEIDAFISEHIHSDNVILTGKIIKSIILLVGVAHVIACIWFAIGRQGGYDPGAVGWVRFHDLQFDEVEVRTQYMWSVHWALGQFTGENVYEPRNMNMSERTYAVIVLLLTFLFSSMFVSSITTSVTQLQLSKTASASALSTLRRYLVDADISTSLAVRVLRNAQHLINEQKRNVPEQRIELLAVVSEPLRAELHFEVHGRVLREHSFFDCYTDINPQGIRKVCHMAVHSSHVSRGDIIFSDLETPAWPRMFFIVSGKLHYKQVEEKPRVLQKDQWAAEAVLWTLWMHVGTLRAMGESDILAVEAEKFQHIISPFPTNHAFLYATAFVECLNNVDEDLLTDLDAKLVDPYLKQIFPERFHERHPHEDGTEARVSGGIFSQLPVQFPDILTPGAGLRTGSLTKQRTAGSTGSAGIDISQPFSAVRPLQQ